MGLAMRLTRLQPMQGRSEYCIRQPHRAAFAFVVASAATLVVAAYWENP